MIRIYQIGKIPEKKARDLLKDWEEKEEILSYYLEHDEIEKIGNDISLIEKQIEIEDIDDARQTIKEVIFLFNHIENKELLNIENFF